MISAPCGGPLGPRIAGGPIGGRPADGPRVRKSQRHDRPVRGNWRLSGRPLCCNLSGKLLTGSFCRKEPTGRQGPQFTPFSKPRLSRPTHRTRMNRHRDGNTLSGGPIWRVSPPVIRTKAGLRLAVLPSDRLDLWVIESQGGPPLVYISLKLILGGGRRWKAAGLLEQSVEQVRRRAVFATLLLFTDANRNDHWPALQPCW